VAKGAKGTHPWPGQRTIVKTSERIIDAIKAKVGMVTGS
jgi:hypothetical protein